MPHAHPARTPGITRVTPASPTRDFGRVAASAADVCKSLSLILAHGNDAERCFAVRALGEIGAPASLQALIAALQDPDEDVRVEVVEALHRLADPQAETALTTSLVEDPCGEVKIGAVKALGRLKASAAVPLLRALVRDRGKNVSWHEADYLAGGWDDWLDVQRHAITALAEIGDESAVEDIVAAMNDEAGQDLSELALQVLANFGTAGVTALAACLASEDDRIRRCAARSLAAIDNAEARAVLSGHLDDRHADVRVAALQAVAAFMPQSPAVVACFKDAAPTVRAAAVTHAGAAHPGLATALLDEPDEAVQCAVIRLWAEAAPDTRPDDLVSRLADKIGGSAVASAIAAAEALVTVAPAAAWPRLRARISDPQADGDLRCAIARLVPSLAVAAVVPALRQVVDADARALRLQALMSLAEIAAADRPESEAARAAIVDALNGAIVAAPDDHNEAESVADQPPETDETAGAATEVTELPAPAPGPVSTLEAIKEAAPKPANGGAADIALTPDDLDYLALAHSTPKRKHVKLDAAPPKHQDVRQLAARVLGSVPHSDTLIALSKVLGDSDCDLRRNAAEALVRVAQSLGALSAPAESALQASLRDSDRDLRLHAIRALAQSRSPETVKCLSAALGDDDDLVRAQAVRSLAGLDCEIRNLDRLLDDQDPGVRLAAADFVAKRGGPAALDQLIELTFAHQGYQRFQIAPLLKALAPGPANAALVEVLENPSRRRERRIAIEALAVINRNGAAAA